MGTFNMHIIMNDIQIILVTGGSCSGKTTFSNFLALNLPGESIVISQDNYFIDYSNYNDNELDEINFDLPESFLMDILIDNIKMICDHQTALLPIYDFNLHKIGNWKAYDKAPKYIIVEGIMTFENKQLFEMASVKIFVEAPLDIMLWRRINRDNIDRFFDVRSSLSRYIKFVRNSYLNIIYPNKDRADIIIDGTNQYSKAIIKEILKFNEK